jgi:AraC-like DNA-binding protein
MNQPILDRLSALLEGLSPRVQMVQPYNNAEHKIKSRCDLALFILVDTTLTISLANPVQTLTLLVCLPVQVQSVLSLLSSKFKPMMSFQATFDGPIGVHFLDEFKQTIKIPLQEADASLAQIIELIYSEMLEPRCGQSALMNRAGDILLIGFLRHLVSKPWGHPGVFKGLSDPRIARTLVAMHSSPSRSWTVELLALEAGMSRTSYANHFKEVMNQSPGKYLSNLRLAMAQRMVSAGHGLKRIAKDTGYASSSTLSRAMGRRC